MKSSAIENLFLEIDTKIAIKLSSGDLNFGERYWAAYIPFSSKVLKFENQDLRSFFDATTAFYSNVLGRSDDLILVLHFDNNAIENEKSFLQEHLKSAKKFANLYNNSRN